MYKFLVALFLTIPIISFSQSNNFLQFESETIHLGKVRKGTKVNSEFAFTNISDEDVVIELVSTCECTEAEWPKFNIKPGASGVIPFVFDTRQKEEEEEISIDVMLKNVDQDGNPVMIFLYYDYEY